MKSSASESKPFQSRSRGEISGQDRRKERLSRSKLKQAFLIDSHAELFVYLSQCIRFGSWKVRVWTGPKCPVDMLACPATSWKWGLAWYWKILWRCWRRDLCFLIYSPNLLMFYSLKTGLKITAGQRTISGKNGLSTGQKFHSPDMLTGHAHSHSWINSQILTWNSDFDSF